MKESLRYTIQLGVLTIFVTTVGYQTIKFNMWLDQRGR